MVQDLEIQVKNLANYPNPSWLREILENVVNTIRPKCGGVYLIITKDINESLKLLGIPGYQRVEIGITGFVKETTGEELEALYWKGSLLNDIFHVFVNPSNVVSSQFTYERVTAGFAHEASELVIIKSYSNMLNIFPEQIYFLEEKIDPEGVTGYLFFTNMAIRERLADSYSAKKGFARELLTVLTPNWLSRLNETFKYALAAENPLFPLLAFYTVGYDVSLSLERANYTDLAEAWLDIWEKGLLETNIDFFNYYKEFRKKLLSWGLNANSLLALLNVELRK